jgi:hypothetical protein
VRRLVCVVVAVTVAAAIAGPAQAALFFLFDRTAAGPGDVVAIRLGGTPKGYAAKDRSLPLQRPIRVYLVPAEDAASVRGRFDPRLHFVGIVRPDRNTRGVLTFRLPPLDPGTYAVASWCPGCAQFSFGSTFFVQTIPRVSRYREEMALAVRMPDAAKACPVTKGAYGNGLLSTTVPGPNGLARPEDLVAPAPGAVRTARRARGASRCAREHAGVLRELGLLVGRARELGIGDLVSE